MRRKVGTLLAVATCLAGCQRSEWVKPGATQQDYVSDTYACEKDMRQSSYFGTGLVGLIDAEAFDARCMNAHGWYLQRVQPASTMFPPAPVSIAATTSPVVSVPSPQPPSPRRQPSSEAMAWQAKAVEAGKNADWPEVVRTSSVAISDANDFADAYVARSQAYLALGFRDKAEMDITKALALEPQNLKAINNRAVLMRDTGKQSRAESDFAAACQGGLTLACDNYKSMMGYLPSEKPQRLIDQSISLYEHGDWEGVIRVTTEAIAIDPRLAWAYVNRSGALANEGKLAAAMADSDKAIALNPDIGLAYFNKAFAMGQDGQSAESSLNYAIACRLQVARACALAGSLGVSQSK
jgi:tetratricopeptide (TPR) repeat protein